MGCEDFAAAQRSHRRATTKIAPPPRIRRNRSCFTSGGKDVQRPRPSELSQRQSDTYHQSPGRFEFDSAPSPRTAGR